MLRCNQASCESPHLRNGNSVLLLCDCLVGICQTCAKRQLVSSEKTYKSYVSCPACGFQADYKQHGLVLNLKEAVHVEDILIQKAFAHVLILDAEGKGARNLDTLRDCLRKLRQLSVGKSESNTLQKDMGMVENIEEISCVSLRYEVADLAFNLIPNLGIPHPLQELSLARNVVLERYLRELDLVKNGTLKQVSTVQHCFSCKGSVLWGKSVQLTCDCDINLCRTCALANMINQADTYQKGVQCPCCAKISRGIVSNVEYVKECENALLLSAKNYLSCMMTANSFKGTETHNERKRYIRFLKLFECLGYQGTISALDKVQCEAASIDQLRLQVALLEEMRLNRTTSVCTFATSSPQQGTSSSFAAAMTEIRQKQKVGFLSALVVKKNTAFEHCYLRQSKIADSSMSSPVPPLDQLFSSHLPQMGVPTTANYELMEKITVIALVLNNSSSSSSSSSVPSHMTSSAHYTISEILTAVRQYLERYECKFKRLFGFNFNTGFMVPLLAKFTIPVVTALVKRLRDLRVMRCNLVANQAETLYALDNWQSVVPSLDPAQSKILSRHLEGNKQLRNTASALASPTSSTAEATLVRSNSRPVDHVSNTVEEGEIADIMSSSSSAVEQTTRGEMQIGTAVPTGRKVFVTTGAVAAAVAAAAGAPSPEESAAVLTPPRKKAKLQVSGCDSDKIVLSAANNVTCVSGADSTANSSSVANNGRLEGAPQSVSHAPMSPTSTVANVSRTFSSAVLGNTLFSTVHTPAAVIEQVSAVEGFIHRLIEEAAAARQEVAILRQQQQEQQLAATAAASTASARTIADLQATVTALEKSSALLRRDNKVLETENTRLAHECKQAQLSNAESLNDKKATLRRTEWLQQKLVEVEDQAKRVQVLERKLFTAKDERSALKAALEVCQRRVTALEEENAHMQSTQIR